MTTFLVFFRNGLSGGKTRAAATPNAASNFDDEPPEYLRFSILTVRSLSVCEDASELPGVGSGICRSAESLYVITATLVPFGETLNHSMKVFANLCDFLNPSVPTFAESSSIKSMSKRSSHPKRSSNSI